MNQKREWINPVKFEEKYCISQSTKSKMRMKNAKIKIPFAKLGSKFIFYDSLEIDAWIERNKVFSIDCKKNDKS